MRQYICGVLFVDDWLPPPPVRASAVALALFNMFLV